MFKVVTIGPGGSRDEDDEVFETEAEAEQHGLNLCGDYSTGAEVLHLHDPSEYPEPDADDQLDFEVIEIADR